jgi:hypothetical protein
VTSDWDLGHEAVPATLLDLAARKHLAVEQRGDGTVVQPQRNNRRDGTSDRIRTWRLRRAVHVPQGAWVSADVAPRTGHVRDLDVRREPGSEPGSGPGTGPVDQPTTTPGDLPMPRPQARAEPH